MPICAVVKHSPRQIAWQLEAHYRKLARSRLERMHDVHAAVAASWAEGGPRNFRELELRLREVALPDQRAAGLD